MKNTKLRAIGLGFTSLLMLGSANAATIAQFDLGTANALGWTLITSSSLSGTNNGVTLTVAADTGNAIDGRNRTGAVADAAGDIARDFLFNNGTISFTFTGLAASQEYEFLTYAYDANGTTGNTGSWYVGSITSENLQHTWNTATNVSTPFTLTGTSNASGELQIFVVAGGNNRANGFEIVQIPEPSTALLGGLGLLALLRRRR
ncbi:MAG: PEP-CTERM sorting domain-containing protein [Luteolibacter sp.]